MDILKLMKLKKKILWGALLSSNIIIFAVVLMILAPTLGDENPPNLNLGIPIWQILMIIALVLVFASNTFAGKAKEIFANRSKLHAEIDQYPKRHDSGHVHEGYRKLSDEDKVIFIAHAKSLHFNLFGWMVAELINITGLVGLFLGMEVDYYYGYFALALITHCRQFPKND